MRGVKERNLGVALQAKQRVEEAIAHYTRTIALRPGYAPAYSNLASALRAGGRLPEAVATYERALALQPDFPDAQYNLGNALLEDGKADAAISHFRLRCARFRDRRRSRRISASRSRQGNDDGATAEAFRAAIAIDPGAAKAHRNLGDVLASMGRTDEAIDHLRRALQLELAMPPPTTTSAAFSEMRRLDEAIAEFHAALTITPNAPETHNNPASRSGPKANWRKRSTSSSRR